MSGLYGVRGWVRVHSFTEPKAALLDYAEWLIGRGGAWQATNLAEGREQGKALVARLEGMHDRDEAARLVGADIAVDRARMPETAPGQYYWSDLEGLVVRHRDGRVLGRVAYLLATGVHDVMVLHAGSGGATKEILVPFVPGTTVLNVDFDAAAIEVDWEWD